MKQGSRAERVGDQIQRELSDLLRGEVRDPRIGLVTLTGVAMSRDYRHATVYFTAFDPSRAAAAQAGLEAAAGFLRRALGARIKLFATPELRFRYDDTIDRAERLDRLLAEGRGGDDGG